MKKDKFFKNSAKNSAPKIMGVIHENRTNEIDLNAFTHTYAHILSYFSVSLSFDNLFMTIIAILSNSIVLQKLGF